MQNNKYKKNSSYFQTTEYFVLQYYLISKLKVLTSLAYFSIKNFTFSIGLPSIATEPLMIIGR